MDADLVRFLIYEFLAIVFYLILMRVFLSDWWYRVWKAARLDEGRHSWTRRGDQEE
jgi:hypothetical protein